jgi:hypothetical protein
MKAYSFVALFLAILLGTASSYGARIPTVPVGNPGNAPDTEIMNDGTSGYGSVGYNYRIGKHEVTNARPV